MKRRNLREREETDAQERAEARREALLAELRARQTGASPATDDLPEENVTPAEAADQDVDEVDEATASTSE